MNASLYTSHDRTEMFVILFSAEGDAAVEVSDSPIPVFYQGEKIGLGRYAAPNKISFNLSPAVVAKLSVKLLSAQLEFEPLSRNLRSDSRSARIARIVLGTSTGPNLGRSTWRNAVDSD